MRLATLRHIRFTSLFVVLFALIGTVIAQEASELGAVASTQAAQDVLGASNPDVSDVLLSLRYDLAE